MTTCHQCVSATLPLLCHSMAILQPVAPCLHSRRLCPDLTAPEATNTFRSGVCSIEEGRRRSKSRRFPRDYPMRALPTLTRYSGVITYTMGVFCCSLVKMMNTPHPHDAAVLPFTTIEWLFIASLARNVFRRSSTKKPGPAASLGNSLPCLSTTESDPSRIMTCVAPDPPLSDEVRRAASRSPAFSPRRERPMPECVDLNTITVPSIQLILIVICRDITDELRWQIYPLFDGLSINRGLGVSQRSGLTASHYFPEWA